MSQEWDEVVHEVDLTIVRLDAFRDDLLAAAAGGKLTDNQRKFARDSTVMANECLLRLLDLYRDATSGEAEQGDGG